MSPHRVMSPHRANWLRLPEIFLIHWRCKLLLILIVFAGSGNIASAAGDLALGQPAFASSQESGSYAPLYAIDGNPGTRWASKLSWADNEWIYVDLGAVTPINRVVLNWEVAYGEDYLIRVSNDANNWTTVYTMSNGNGGIDDMSFATRSARYVLMQGIKRGTPYGYSLWDFEVYGSSGEPPVLTSIAVSPTSATVTVGDTRLFTATGLDQFGNPMATTVNWSITPGTGAGTINGSGLFTATVAGSVTVTATDTNNIAGVASASVVDAPVPGSDLAQGKLAIASSNESGSYAELYATDGDPGTRWASKLNWADNEWIYVDLGAITPINRVVLNWEVAYGQSYLIRVSDDALNWTTVVNETNGNGGIDDMSFATESARYVLMQGIKRGTPYGYSLWDFEVYGTGEPPVLTSIAVSPTSATVTVGDTRLFTATGLDQFGNPMATTVNWSITPGTGAGTINGSGLFTATVAGSVTVTATDTNNSAIAGEASASVVDAPVAGSDLAQGKLAIASSQESGSYATLFAVDGDPGTRWASKLSWENDEWIYVDLGAITPINRVVLNWEVAYGEDYLIRVSNDANNWTTVYTMTNGNGGIDDMSFATESARYVLMQGIKRGTPYGYSLWDFEVYGTGEPPVFTSIAVSPTSATVTVGDTRLFTATGLDQFGNPMATTVNWSITPGTGAGTIDGSGLFTATVAGSVTVTARDSSNNAISGQASVTVIDTPTSCVVLPVVYDFTDGDVSAWSRVNNTPSSGTWQVINGAYHQSTDVFSRFFGHDESYKLGTYSYLPSLGCLSDYQLSVDITPLKDDPPEDAFGGKDAGVMFRYKDDNNYYRLSFNTRDSYARLERKAGGNYTTLATNARGYTEGQKFNVRIRLDGDLIQVLLDGDPIFAVSDSAHSSGTIALYSQDAMKFDNVRIDPRNSSPSLILSTPLAYSVNIGSTADNLALKQPAFASSQESGSYATLFAVDGDPDTRWASKLNWADNEWIYVDLGAITPINRVVLNWEVAYGQSYLIRVSDDALNWTTVVNETNGNGGIDDMSFATESARYVLMQGIKRGTPYGYSLWDFEVYGDGGTVSASAVVTNMPAGGSVEFEIGGAACGATTEVSPGLFTSNCGNPGQGDYYLPGMGVRSTLRNNSGGIVASDENTRIGVAGNSYITVGDSLTEGIFDLYPADNQSLDGRIIGKQGFQARLNDLLTTSTLTNTLFNEAVGGDKTPDTLTRIDSILERHPGSNRALMMLGTNDSGGSTPLSSSQYKDNMQLLANRMIAQGNEVWISLLPPALPYSANLTRNGDIEGYNAAIKTMSNIQIGPDFFTFFYNDNDNKGPNNEYNVVNERVSLYYDNVHPNALGSRIMSILWANSLKGTQIIPFVLDRLCNRLVSGNCNAVTPSNHKQNLLGPGNEYYIDETYTLNSVPAVLADGIWILPANAESDNTDDNYIEFTIDRPVTVYVAYDDGASLLPDWLDPASPSSDFTDAFLNIQTTDPLSSTLHVYSQTFSADAESPSTVSLGGNMAAGAIGANSNYLVIVVEQ